MKIKRRSFFTTVLLAIGSIFVPRRAQTIQLAGRDYVDEFAGPTGLQGPRGPTGNFPLVPGSYINPNLGDEAFSNRFLSRYEGQPIPKNVVFGQAVGRINQTPFHPQAQIKTVKLRSTTKE